MNATTKISKATFEALEQRRMLAGTPYYINGTDGNDSITVTTHYDLSFGGRLPTVGLTRAIRGLKISPNVTIEMNGSVRTDVVSLDRVIMVDAGAGDDRIKVIGPRGMSLFGNVGNDAMSGGGGADFFMGGPGMDTVDYSARTTPLFLSLDDQPNDGATNEHDHIVHDVEILRGGQAGDSIKANEGYPFAAQLYGNGGNDTITGSPGDDLLDGGAGDDLMLGYNGTDWMWGGDGSDRMYGGAGRDIISGDAGNDILRAESGNDALYGGAGDDRLYSGQDNDMLSGGLGSDTLVALGGGQSDTLWGGIGTDHFWCDVETTEKIKDYDFYVESKTFHKIASFDQLKQNGQPAGTPSRELLGQNLPDPACEQYAVYRNYSANPLFSSSGPTADDVEQGMEGDCYFLAGLSAVAKVSPMVIRRSIVDLGDGTFAINFKDGPHGEVNHFVRVDAELPTEGNNTLPYAKLGAQNSLWVAIMEKAWAFYRASFGSYQSTESGTSHEVFHMFGLQDSSSTFSNANTLATTLSTLLSQNQAVCVATSATPSTLTQKHEYMVDRIFTDSLGRKMVTLRNPWAKDGPGGDISDDGYVTLTVASLLKDMTKLEWAKPA